MYSGRPEGRAKLMWQEPGHWFEEAKKEAARANQMTLASGTKLGSFEIVASLGTGGMDI